jgi:formylglycine-generating enzyme required for sulfatase activity
MRVTALFALAALLAAAPAVAQDSPAEQPAPLHYLGLNRQGAEEWWRAKDGAVVIRIPGGPYMHRAYEGMTAVEAPKSVPVASFFMDKFEVTNAQFARFLYDSGAPGNTPFVRREVPGLEIEQGQLSGGGGGSGGVRQYTPWRATPGMEQHPVTACTGKGAMAYAEWAGARIPTPHEWMKAAGGAEGRLYPWGDAEPDESRANYARTERRGLEPVGSHPLGASPYGCMDMAGNAYDRVMVARGRDGDAAQRSAPVMIKGGSWVSSHPLNLRVLDLCMQPAEVAEASVGFRCATDDPEPDRKPRTAEDRPVLRVAKDFDAAVAEARSRKVPIFLSLLHDTCGQCDRTIAQCYRDPRFVKYCNENMVVVLGHQPWDADDKPHAERKDGSCTVHPGLRCREHEELYRRGLAVVGGFITSPGNFVLDPSRTEKGAGAKAVLVEERTLPKWGDAVDEYLAAFERARAALAAR